MCLLCAYTTRMVSGWPMTRGQPAIVDGASVREPARFAALRKGASAVFKLTQTWKCVRASASQLAPAQPARAHARACR